MSNPSPVPRACRNCSVAKAKCTWISTSKCERCNRLNKDCNKQVMARQPKGPRVTQAAKIEKKLDGLMSLLNTTHQLPPNAAIIASGSGLISSEPSDGGPHSAGPSTKTPNSTESTSHGGGHQGNPSEAETVSFSSVVDGVFLDHEADRLLDIYRNSLVMRCPFVVISTDMPAWQVRQDTPFLFLTILFATSYENCPRQHILGDEIMKYVSEHLLLKGERSLDLLQGLLVYITWYHYHVSGPLQINLFLQLLIAVLTDLGLNRASVARETQDALFNQIKQQDPCAANPLPMSNATYRAVIGCFYLSSTITSTSSKLDPMPYTSHIEDCLQSLAVANEYNADFILVQMVKLQKIVEDIRCSALHSASSMKGLVDLYVKAFQRSLQDYKTALPPGLQQNTSILLHYHSAEIQLYQVGFQMPQVVEENLKFQRMEILSACLSATKGFCAAWLSIPPSLYYTLSLGNFGQLTRALLVFLKLCVFHAEDWDAPRIRQQANLSFIIDEMINRMEEASITFGRNHSSCPFMKSVTNLKLGKSWYERELGKSSVEEDISMDLNGGSADAAVLWSQLDAWNEDLWGGFMAS